MPLFWLSLAFLCGIALADVLGWPLSAWLWLGGGTLLLVLLHTRFRRPVSDWLARLIDLLRLPRLDLLPQWSLPRFSPLWLLFALALGGARLAIAQPVQSPDFIAWYNDYPEKVVIEGLVIAYPDQRDGVTLLRVQAERLRGEDDLLYREVSGVLLARVHPYGSWRYGDRLQLEGYLETPPENQEFSYRAYLARQGIHSYFSCSVCQGCTLTIDQTCARILQRDQGSRLRAAIYAVRQKAHALITSYLPDPEASLLAGILLGIETGIPETVNRAFQDSGTSHIIAISGFNFAIVAGLITALFSRLLGRWKGMLAAFVGIAVYALLAGANAAVIRAAVMGSLSVLALNLGRRQLGVNTLLIVAGLMALADPFVLWDVSFQLSFTATLGLVLYAQNLQEWFLSLAARFAPPETLARLARPVSEYLLFTFAAQLTTLPVILYHFQRLSLVSLLANPLILPAQPPLMILGGISALAGLVFEPLGQWLAYLTWPFLVYTIRLVEALAAMKHTVLVLGQTSLPLVMLFYAALFGWTLWGERLRGWLASRPAARWLPGKAGLVGILILLPLTLGVWRAVFLRPDGLLRLTVLDVGSGDALLIRTPGGKHVLIDGGPSSTRLSDALGRRLPFWDRGLDWLLVAGTGAEQVGGLPYVVERFKPEQVLWAGPPTADYAALTLQEKLAEVQIPVTAAQAGQELDLGRGARLQVLAVTPRGAIYMLCWGNFSALLPIGLEFESMEALMRNQQLGDITALLLADSGYVPLNPPGWIQRWSPQVILLSVEAGDYDGRPDPETLAAVEGYSLLRTDQNGWIEISTDGEQMWVQVERK